MKRLQDSPFSPGRLASVALLSSLILACPATAAEQKADILAEGAFSAIDQPQQTVLHDAAAYAALWASHAAHEEPPAKAPAVDFAKDTVAAVFAGTQPTGGISLAVSSLRQEKDGWHLRLELRKPGPDCMVTQALTQPWMLVRIPGSGQAVNMDIRVTEESCQH
jgi:hypothetical protein